ncbi:hypothetical protein Sjap_021200 [Stephania japonica]|uniref:Uncharacterized protein n=1 Tax=Stephania japonica TaxID=461633 RepID=A0AAP0F3D1_9MAGN
MSTEIQESSEKRNREGEGEGEGGEGEVEENGTTPPPNSNSNSNSSSSSEIETERRQDGEKSVSVVAGLKVVDPTVESGIGPNDKEKAPVAEEIARSEGGSRTFTMRELLNELKEDRHDADRDSGGGNATSPLPYSEDNSQQQYIGQNKVAMELINSVTGVDEEGRSRQRILTFAAKRYASAIERNPEDYDALYNWALVLQESADNVDPDSSFPSKDSLLEEACKKYDEATRLCPTLHDAFYNWAIAISDRAKMRGRTKEAEELWKQVPEGWKLGITESKSNPALQKLTLTLMSFAATKNYEKAVQLNWNSPQALNNWGLALQELSAIVPVREKQNIVKTAISKFRSAIQLQFDFHRAIYNLGTVLYGLAEDTLRTGRPINAKEVSPNELYSQSAIYIAAAHALKPNYSLNKVEQKQLTLSPSGRLPGPTNTDKSALKIDVSDIVSVAPCADLTLPPGAGICIDTIHGPIFLVADTWESLEGWLDAIRLVYTIFARGKSDVLAGIITS